MEDSFRRQHNSFCGVAATTQQDRMDNRRVRHGLLPTDQKQRRLCVCHSGRMCQNRRMHLKAECDLIPSAGCRRILLLGCFVLAAGCLRGSLGTAAGGAGGKVQTGGTGGGGVAGSASGTGGSTATAGTTASGGSAAGGATPDAAVDAPLVCIGPTVSEDPTLRSPGPRPDAAANSCGAWALTDGVCCAQYCRNDDKSEDCSSCGGPGSPQCTVVNSRACTSGRWPEVHCVSDNEPWHYSRSTHFGLTSGGACAFGLYGLCTTAFNFTDPTLEGVL
jgi:hypothetical protein